MRTRLILLIVAIVGADVMAFDSVAWEEKRAMHLAEAVRLQAAYTNCASRIDTPAEDVSLPLETFADGSVKSIVSAKKAQYFLKSGFVWAEGVTIVRYRADRTVESRVEADNCVVDRFSKSGWAEGEARVFHGKTTMKGRNVYFSTPDSYVKVFRDAVVESDDARAVEVRR